MRMGSMLLRALGVERAVVEKVDWQTDEWMFPPEAQLIVRVRPVKGERRRCPHCNRRCPGYDGGHGERRWRAPDFGLLRVFLVAAAPRVACAEHGVVVARVPWARHDSGFTRAFEDTVAWLVTRTDKSTLAQLLRVAWRTVGAIVERVVDSLRGTFDPFADLTRIGIDEVSYRKGQRYLTVVVDHATGRLLWAAPKAEEATLRQFFDLLGPERCARIQLVSADGAAWIHNVVKERCPNATLCMDPFHVVQWATDALDKSAPQRLERTARQWAAGTGERAQASALGVVEEPGGSERAATGVLGLHPTDQSTAVPSVSAQRTTARDLSYTRPGRLDHARQVDRVGPALAP